MKSIEQRMRPVATRQDGVFTVHQAVAAGITRQALSRWVRAGHGQRLHRGVYLLNLLPPAITARRRAAVLATGRGAMIGGMAALDEYDIEGRNRRDRTNAVVVLTARSHGFLHGVQYIRSTTLCDDDVTTWHGQRFPTIERVLVDIVAHRSELELCKLMSEAAFRGLLDLDRLDRTMDRNRNHAGIRTLIAAVARYCTGENGVDSGGEQRLADRLTKAGVTDVRFNVELEIHGTRIRVDAYVEWAGLVIELDPVHHERPDKAREDELRTSLCTSIGLHTIRIRGTAMEAGVAEVVAYLAAHPNRFAKLVTETVTKSAKRVTARAGTTPFRQVGHGFRDQPGETGAGQARWIGARAG